MNKLIEQSSSKEEELSEFMPVSEMPIEDRFLINFKENGGKFLYCVNAFEVQQNFQAILRENHWGLGMCRDQNLKSLFKNSEIDFTDRPNADFCLITCEFLVADTGSILISSNQIGEKKLKELPNNLVIYAGMGQLVNTVSDGLQHINLRRQKIPSNITTIKNFSNQMQPSHFMNYGSISKNLYLLLYEDFE